MSVSFNGISLRPVQSLTINQSSDFSENGKLKKYLFSISISGKIVAAQDQSVDSRHEEIKSKVQALLTAFKNVDANSNTFLDIQSQNGAPAIKFIPRIKNVQIQDGTWVDFADYSLDLEADEIFIGGTKIPLDDLSQTLYDKDDNWSISYSDEDKKFITVNHSISARAKDTDTKKGWQIAKEYVDEQITLSGNIVPQEIDSATGRETTGKPLINKKIKYDVSILNGQINAEIELTFHDLLSNPTQNNYATHDQTITENESRETILKSTSVEGNIIGLLNISSSQSSGEHRYSNALALWEIVKNEIEAAYINKNLLSRTITQDKTKGTISYTYEYNDSENVFGGKSENITISQSEASQVIIVNDAINNQGDGPIFQDMSTKKAKTKTVTIDVISDSNIVPDTSSYSPSINAILDSDSVQYSLNSGKVTRTTSWIWV